MMEETEEFQGTITKAGDIYEVSYPPDHEWSPVKIIYSKFSTTKDGIEKATVRVKYQEKTVHWPNRVSINVSSGQTQSIESAAKRCNQSQSGVKWGALLDEASTYVIEEREKGNPVENLKYGTISESAQYIVEPFLVSSQSNLLYGDGGLGKSWFALYLGALVASGKRHGGLTPEPGNVMYVDYEVDKQDMENRFIALCNGLGIEPPDFLYLKQEKSINHDQARMAQLVAEHNIQFMIIDSAAMACGGEPEAADVATRYWNALRTLGCTTLTIAHVSKTEASEKGTSTPYGSVFWRNYARNAWEIKRGTIFKRLEKQFGLVQTKLNSGAGDDPRNFLFTFDDGTLATKVTVHESIVENNDSLMATSTTWKRIEKYIRDQREVAKNEQRFFEGVEVADINENVDDPEGTIRTNLTRMTQSKLLVMVERGVYDIKSEYEKDQRVARYDM